MSSTRTPARPRPSRPATDRPKVVGSPTGTRSRFIRRRRAGRLRAALRVAAVLLVATTVAVAAWAVYYSSMFGVQRVIVVGTHRVTAAQVVKAARVRMGAATLRVDTAAIRRHVESITQLESVVVTTQWPHTVTITVVERTPVAVEQLTAGGYELLDRDGVDLGQVANRPALLPLLLLDPQTTSAATTAAAAQVAASLTRRLAAKVASITALTANSVLLRLTDGTVVRWGDASQGAIKAEVLAALMKHHGVVYDVSAPYAPTLSVG